jgi:hypothetical protein
MKPRIIIVILGFAFLSVVAVLFLALRSENAPIQISASLLGTTNGFVGVTNGSWTVYTVTNHTTNSFYYAGAKIELRMDNNWILDPALTPTEIGGWLAPPNRAWHDGRGKLTSGGSFHVFFNTPENGARWRASLRFLPNQAFRVPPSLRTNTAMWAALAEDVMSVLDRKRPYDCSVPEAVR